MFIADEECACVHVMDGRASLDSPLAGMMVVLASESHESEEFKQVWLDVLEAAGCNVLTRLTARRKHCYLSAFSQSCLWLLAAL